jgi:branched-chain amino acid transport system substrate-binding protein
VRTSHRVAATAAVALLVAGATATGASSAAKAKTVKCPKGITIAFMGALSGEAGELGKNMTKGAQIAFDDWNKANKSCQVKFDTSFDSQGSPDQASPLAPKIAGNKNIVGLIGPGFSGESKATMPVFQAAGLAAVTPSATNATLTANGWTVFHRVLANDDKQGPGVVKLIQKLGAKKVGVIDDKSEYGKGLADIVRAGLGATKVADDQIDPKSPDYSAAINKMKAAGVDAVFFGGYYADAGQLLKQMIDAGVKVQFISGDGSLDTKFIEAAGSSNAEGTYLTATGAPADVDASFAAKHQARWNEAPALYAPESYDAANVFLNALKAGKTTRKAINAYIDTYNQKGITKQIKFTKEGEVDGDAVYSYQVNGGKLVFKGII